MHTCTKCDWDAQDTMHKAFIADTTSDQHRAMAVAMEWDAPQYEMCILVCGAVELQSV